MIDEKKLIKDIRKACELNASGLYDEDIIKIINLQPKSGDWMPISEGFPKEDGRYLCAYGKESMDVYSFSNDLFSIDDYDFAEYKFKKKKGFFRYDSEWGYCEVNWITAWRPLPEPYKER